MSNVFVKLSSGMKSVGRLFNNLAQKIRNMDPEKSRKSKHFLRAALVAVTIIFALAELVFGIMIYGYGTKDSVTRIAAKIVPFPAAVTSEGVVTINDYFHDLDYVKHFYEQTKQSDVDEPALKKQIMVQLVENKIINSEGIKHKIEISDDEINQTVDKIIEENGGKDEVERVLNELYGLSLPEFKNLIRTQLLRDKINDTVLTHVKASHILIKLSEDASDEDIATAQEKISGIRKEITDGTTTFVEAAKKYSEDIGSAENGGTLEPFGRGDMIKEFEDVAFSTEPGTISEPFRSSFGFHIVQVDSKTGYIDRSFADWLEDLKRKTITLYFI